MPRQRSKTATKTETKPERKLIQMPMTPDQIRAVYAKRRTKGLYLDKLALFIESGEGGVSVKEEWATEFADKKATSLKQGFENAKAKNTAPEGSQAVDIIVDGEDVYLLNRAILDAEVVDEAA